MVAFVQAMRATSTVDDLRRYFESFYREGGEFQSEEYQDSEEFDHSWKHLRTGIVVWKDAIDCHQAQVPRCFFTTQRSYLSETSRPLRRTAEVWASLRTEGKSANAWWGRGVYTVPKSPDQWAHRMELLDNNFRNMIKRDVNFMVKTM